MESDVSIKLVHDDSRVDMSLIPLGDGLTIVRKK